MATKSKKPVTSKTDLVNAPIAQQDVPEAHSRDTEPVNPTNPAALTQPVITRKSRDSIETSLNGTKLSFIFSNGQAIDIDTTTLSPEIREAAMIHGLRAKLIDGAAMSRNTVTGKPASMDDKFNAVNEIATRITAKDGTWNKGRSGESAPKTTILVRAIAEVMNKTIEQAKEFVAQRDKAQIAGLKAHPRIRPVILRMEMEQTKAAPSDGIDDLLAGFGD